MSTNGSIRNTQSTGRNSNSPNTSEDDHCEEKGSSIVLFSTLTVILVSILVAYSDQWRSPSLTSKPSQSSFDPLESQQCYHTCKLEIVESVPQNLTVNDFHVRSTFKAWHLLVSGAEKSLDLAAYKSSLRGKHVLGGKQQDFSSEGDLIFEELRRAGSDRHVNIRIVENAPSKDKGDNEDARSLQKAGLAALRKLNLQKIYNSGTMHSKFIIADGHSFYLGSANLDWRSLSQKMELGVLVQDCPCLAKELKHAFDMYWHAAEAENDEELRKAVKRVSPNIYNMERPLKIKYDEVDTEVYMATSPRMMNAPERTWDLDALIYEINQTETHIFIHVMDYFPMFLYSNNRKFWPVIDNAIRGALMRGVEVKIIAAALHYPKIGLRFLKSLQELNGIARGNIQVKIIKIPTPAHMQSVIRRERRTHKKYVVTDTTAIIGTSNWSGDYFEGVGTGVAFVVRQGVDNQPFVDTMRGIFHRDWNSVAAHDLDEFFDGCVAKTSIVDFCEHEKDKSLLINPK